MKTTYLIPAALLYQAAKMLQPPERLCFVTGVKLAECIVLAQLMEVAVTSASRVHVEPHPGSVLRMHRYLLSIGMDIEAQFHSHPGHGADATHPSYIDIHTARRWETGAPFLGGIFSEGGRYVRFFNSSQNSEVKIYGRDVRNPEPNLFELSSVEDNPLPAAETPDRRAVADRPPGKAPVVEPISGAQCLSLVRWLGRLGQ